MLFLLLRFVLLIQISNGKIHCGFAETIDVSFLKKKIQKNKLMKRAKQIKLRKDAQSSPWVREHMTSRYDGGKRKRGKERRKREECEWLDVNKVLPESGAAESKKV